MEYIDILRLDIIEGNSRFETDDFGQDKIEVENNKRVHTISIEDASSLIIHEGDRDTPSDYTFTPKIDILDVGFIPNIHEDDTVININFTKSQGLEIASLLEGLLETKKLETNQNYE